MESMNCFPLEGGWLSCLTGRRNKLPRGERGKMKKIIYDFLHFGMETTTKGHFSYFPPPVALINVGN